jgi:hypothetical protein
MEPGSIDWSKEPASDEERKLRETALLYAVSTDLFSQVEVLLIAGEVRKSGPVPADLAAAEDHALSLVREWMGDHRDSWARQAKRFLANHPNGPWA